MKLLDLEPHWCSAGYWMPSPNSTSGRIQMYGDNRHGMGLSFLCPVHRDHRLAVLFSNPIDGGPAGTLEEGRYAWQRTGETFETLTLGPSIDASAHSHGNGQIETPCWHGFIVNGEVT
jgi:hypothetical protein